MCGPELARAHVLMRCSAYTLPGFLSLKSARSFFFMVKNLCGVVKKYCHEVLEDNVWNRGQHMENSSVALVVDFACASKIAFFF